MCFFSCAFLGPVPQLTCMWTWREVEETLQLINHQWLVSKGPRGWREGRDGREGGGRAAGALLPHDKICFIYLTATAALLQNPTISHHRAFLQGQLEWGCLATENKAGFHYREHTRLTKSLFTADLAGELDWRLGRLKRVHRKKDARQPARSKLACSFEIKAFLF